MKGLMDLERLQESGWATPLLTTTYSLKCQLYPNTNLVMDFRPRQNSDIKLGGKWSVGFCRGQDSIAGSRKDRLTLAETGNKHRNLTHGTIRTESLALVLKPTLWCWQSISPQSFPAPFLHPAPPYHSGFRAWRQIPRCAKSHQWSNTWLNWLFIIQNWTKWSTAK